MGLPRVEDAPLPDPEPGRAGQGGLAPTDCLHLGAVAALAVLTVTHVRPLGPVAYALLLGFAVLAAAVVGVARRAPHHPWWRLAHEFSSIVVVPAVFFVLGLLIEVANTVRWDAFFAALDRRWFGSLSDDWRAFLGRPWWFVDINALVYASYYVVPLLVAIPLYRRDRGAFRHLVFAVTLTFYAAYVCYVLLPTIGPRVPSGPDAGMGGGAVTRLLERFLAVAETTRTDAFPSGHVAVALVCLWYAPHVSRRLTGTVAAFVVGIAFSTVYLHFHYVVDVVAGIGLAAMTTGLSPYVEPLLKAGQPAPRPSWGG